MFEKLKAYLLSRLPVQRQTVIREASLNRQPASLLDVDRVHAILTEADNQNPRDLFATYEEIFFDGHIFGEFSKRKLAIMGDPMNISPADDKSADDKKAVDLVKGMVQRCPSFFNALGWLLDGTLFPVAVVEKVYRRSATPGIAYDLDKLVRVHPDLFAYEVNGKLRLRNTNLETGDILGTTHDPDPLRYILHRGHLMTAPDYRGGPLRCLIFWWLFSNFDRDWWVRFLDRFGSPFLVGKYNQGDDASRVVLESAFGLATKLGGLVISNETQVEVVDAMSKAGTVGFETFHAICQREKSKLILGQTSSAEIQSTGLNSDLGETQAKVRDDIRMFDALTLGNTLRTELFEPWLRINGFRGNVTVSWGAEQVDDTEKTSAALANLANAGVELTDDGIQAMGQRMNLGLRRKTLTIMPPPPNIPGKPPLKTLAAIPGTSPATEIDLANDAVARAGRAELARAFSGAYAPIRLMILDSKSPADLELRIRSHYADWPGAKVTALLTEALETFSANGVSAT